MSRYMARPLILRAKAWRIPSARFNPPPCCCAIQPGFTMSRTRSCRPSIVRWRADWSRRILADAATGRPFPPTRSARPWSRLSPTCCRCRWPITQSEAQMHKPQSLFEKVWDSHVVRALEGEPTLLYIDLHLVHEVTTPQAFEGLRMANRKVRRPDLTFATIDHNVPTTSDERFQIKDQVAAQQIATLRKNCEAAGIPLFDIGSGRQGIVHVIGPALGLTQPGLTIVCGDSHTSTHGAFGAL